MPNIEILAYFPKQSMKQFIDFVVNGTPTDPTASERKPGVFKWLYQREVLEAHFFTSAENDPVQVFVSTILQPDSEKEPVPWTDNINGFSDCVNMTGDLGVVHVQPDLSKPAANITRNVKLDQLFVQNRKPFDEIFALLRSGKSDLSFTVRQLKAALRGDPKIDTASLLSEIETKLNITPFAKVDLASITESQSVGSRA